VLLVRDPMTLQSTAVYAADPTPVSAEVLLSNWTIGGFPAWAARVAEVVWTARISSAEQPFARGSHALAAGDVPQGQTQPVVNATFHVPVLPGGTAADAVILEARLLLGGATAATNSWRILAVQQPSPARVCDIAVFAEAQFLDSARTVCSNAVVLPSQFTPPSKPFVVMANELQSDVADAAQQLGGTALILNPQQQGQFPVCATSVVGTVPPPFVHTAGQAWWFVAGPVGTLVYNTSLTEMLSDATSEMFLDLGFTSVVEKSQGFVLDGLQNEDNSTLVHVRSIPADILSDSTQTLVHNQALVWEANLPVQSTAAGVEQDTAHGGAGRFIVSGLNIFEEGQIGKLRASEPQAGLVFRSLLEHAMRLASERAVAGSVVGGVAASRARMQAPKKPLCSRVSSICVVGTEAPCKAVALETTGNICGGNFSILTPTTFDFATVGAATMRQNATVDAIHVYIEPNDVRNKDAALVGLLYRSDSLGSAKQLLGSGTAVSPFTNWSFNGLQPLGKPVWVRLPMPAVRLPAAAQNGTVFWVGMLGSKDTTCFGAANKGAGSPPLGPLAPDNYAKTPMGASTSAAWTNGSFSFSAYASLK
jgi:hypothetical protein